MMLCPNCGKETPENPDCVNCGFPLPKITSGVLVPDPARDVTTAQPPQKGTSGNLVPDPTGDVTMPLKSASGNLVPDPTGDVTMPLKSTSGNLVAALTEDVTMQPPPVQPPPSPPGSVPGTSTPPPGSVPGTSTPPPIRGKGIGLIVLLILLIVGIIVGLVVYFVHQHKPPTNTGATATATASQEKLPSLPPRIYTTQFPNKEYVGVNDGSQSPFDIRQHDSQNLRKQAIDVLQKNQDPTSLWNEYLGGANSNDAEISIYRENLRIKNSYPYFTLIVGLDFLASSVPGAQTPTRSALQGIYLAQKEFNDDPNNTTKMQLLLANTGDDPSYVSAVAAQIAGIVKQDKDKRIFGIIGWQTSVRTQAMLDALHQDKVELPMVSETASYDNLSDASPNFFGIAASDEQQAKLAVALIHQQKDSQVIVFKDDGNLYSQNIAQDFEDNFPGCAPQSSTSTCIEVPFATEHTKAAEYITALTKALKGHDINHLAVFFTGSTSYDMVQLQDALAKFNNYPRFPIFTGDAGYVAQPASYDRWYVLAYAYHDEWLRLMGLVSPFSQAYDQTFNPHNRFKGRGYGYEIPDAVSIISYDTARVVAQSVNKVLSSQSPNLQSALATITSTNPWQGVSGQIAFDKNRHLVDRALIVLEVKTIIDPKTGKAIVDPKTGKTGGSFQMICLQNTFSSAANNSLPKCPT